MDALQGLIEEVIEEMAKPVFLCRCHLPLVKEPDLLHWCECHGCGRSVPYTAVVDGAATVASRVH